MQIIEPNGARFDVALERLIEGHSFTFHDVRFWLSPVAELEINFNSRWALQNITHERALEDLVEAQVVYEDLRRRSAAFASAVRNATPRFILVHDYRGGVVEVARLVNGQIAWAKGFMPSSQDDLGSSVGDEPASVELLEA